MAIQIVARGLKVNERELTHHVLNGPIEHVVVLEALTVKELFEKPLQVSVVGAIFEAQTSAILEIRTEFRGVTLAQLLGASGHFAVHNPLVLLLLSVGLQTLPREAASDEVHEHIPERLKVIPAALL